ncbi:MAG: Ig-like domain-containing protein, partial [Patescibacteria group bacterium]
AKTLVGTPVEQFKAPKAVWTGKDVLDGKQGKEETVKIDISSGKLATDATPSDLIIEKTFSEIHDILYYVDKDNPRGPAPGNPYDDAQYANWEAGVQDWAKRNNLVAEKAPTDIDDTHRSDLTPSLTITSPHDNDYISGDTLNVYVQTSAARGVARVEYYLDDRLIDVVTSDPFTLNYALSGEENGTHTLMVKSLDDLGNTQAVSMTLNFMTNAKRSSIKWIAPASGASVSVNTPVPLKNIITVADGSSLSAIKNVSWYVSPWNQESYSLISSDLSPTSTSLSASWTPSLSGRYTLLVKMTDGNGSVVGSARIRVTVK